MFAVRLRIFVDTGWPDSTIRDSIASSHRNPKAEDGSRRRHSPASTNSIPTPHPVPCPTNESVDLRSCRLQSALSVRYGLPAVYNNIRTDLASCGLSLPGRNHPMTPLAPPPQ